MHSVEWTLCITCPAAKLRSYVVQSKYWCSGRIVLPAEVLPVDLAQTFAIGQRLQGEVVRIVPHGGVLVNFDGQPVLLALAQQVVPGQILTATVAQVSPRCYCN